MRGRETLIAIGIIGSGVDSRQSNSLASLASPATPGDLCANDADGARPASGALRRHLREYMSFPEESQPITAGPEFHLAILNPQSSIGHRPSSIVHRPSSIVNRAAALSLAPFSIMHHLGPGLSCCLRTRRLRTRRLRGRGVPLIFGLSASYCVPLRLTAAEIRRTAQSEKTADLLPHFPISPIPQFFPLASSYALHTSLTAASESLRIYTQWLVAEFDSLREDRMYFTFPRAKRNPSPHPGAP